MQASINGQVPIPSPFQAVPGQGFGPVGGDEPLFPDNLSVSLVVSAPFAPFDGSPDPIRNHNQNYGQKGGITSAHASTSL